jgi:hypothetical protein
MSGVRGLKGLWKYAVVAVIAFAVGGGGVVASASNGIQIGSLVFVPVVNGQSTPPCTTTGTVPAQTTTCTAVVDSQGQLAVSDANTQQSLAQLRFDSSGNLKVTMLPSGSQPASPIPVFSQSATSEPGAGVSTSLDTKNSRILWVAMTVTTIPSQTSPQLDFSLDGQGLDGQWYSLGCSGRVINPVAGTQIAFGCGQNLAIPQFVRLNWNARAEPFAFSASVLGLN